MEKSILLKKKDEQSEVEVLGFGYITTVDEDTNTDIAYASLVVRDDEAKDKQPVRVIIGKAGVAHMTDVASLRSYISRTIVVTYLELKKSEGSDRSYHRVRLEYAK